MSREALLDEAITKAKECEDWQLVEWLRMARGGESAARWYSEKLREAHRTERKLLDENAKLVMKLNAEHIVRQNVERENAKLRELVRDMLACINNVSAHDTYCWDYCDFCKMYITKGRCDFESRMRELGVEV